MRDRIGPFDVVSEAGRGAMGVVYRARHRETGQEVACKVLLPTAGASEASRKRLAREADAIRSFDHPALVRLVESGVNGDERWVAMEFVEGMPLDRWAAAHEPSPRQAVEIVRAIADGLAHAHARGVIHRDLKPGNVLVDAAGRPRVTDFGLSRIDTADESSVTTEGAILGTPAYMSPEQARGDHAAVDGRSDVFALGAVLFDLLTGRPPFGTGSAAGVIQRILHETPGGLRAAHADIDHALETVCLQCLAKEPEQRYGSARDLGADLDRWLAGQPVLARRPGGSGTHGRAWLAVGALGIAGIAAVALVAARTRPPAGAGGAAEPVAGTGTVPPPGPPVAPAPPAVAPGWRTPGVTALPARARVTGLADGDSFYVEVDGRRDEVRVLGIDAPEFKHPTRGREPFADTCADRVRAKIGGREITLDAETLARDRYGRLLAHVEVDGEDLAATLLAEGLARVYARAEHARRSRYLELERAAREARRGIWGTAEPRDGR